MTENEFFMLLKGVAENDSQKDYVTLLSVFAKMNRIDMMNRCAEFSMAAKDIDTALAIYDEISLSKTEINKELMARIVEKLSASSKRNQGK